MRVRRTQAMNTPFREAIEVVSGKSDKGDMIFRWSINRFLVVHNSIVVPVFISLRRHPQVKSGFATAGQDRGVKEHRSCKA